MALPRFILELRDVENRERCLQAIRTRYLLALALWTFVMATYLIWGMGFYLIPIHIVVSAVLLINTASYYLTRKWLFPTLVAIASIIIDIIAIAVLIHFTGGFNSMFFALFLVQILGVSLFLNLQFSALMIAWTVIVVGVMRNFELNGVITLSSQFIPTSSSELTDTVIWLTFQGIILCLVAFLGGNLSNKLKFREKELGQKKELEKLYKALQKTDESKTRLLVNVSHNLRTPLTAILGFSELLLAEDESKAQRKKFAEIIYSESQHLAQLVNDVLYLSNLETDGVEWRMARTDISKLVIEAAAAMRGSARQKGLKLAVDSSTAPLIVFGDASRLKDVVTRLIDNAVKFTIEGAISVSVTGEKDSARVSISDTGIGIASDVKDRVFEPLEPIYKTEHQEVPQRTGLGLAICQAIIKHHGGKIWVESKLDKGSTFYFTLPLLKTR